MSGSNRQRTGKTCGKTRMRTPNKEIWNGDYKCINIECERDIPAHIVEKQFTHPKNRACTVCRGNRSIRWHCIGCNKLISNNTKRVGTFYCTVPCRMHTNSARTYVRKVKPIKLPSIIGCEYCTKALTHNNKLKFCDSKCRSKHRKLEERRALYKADMIKRANARMLAKKPNYDIEKRKKHKKSQQLYMKRRYNIRKLVADIQKRATNI